MSAHTPGPWFIRTNRHTSTDGRPWGWLDAAPPGGPQRNIPGVQVTWTRGEASEANARLIAAAPDMLEALRQAKSSLVAFKLMPGPNNAWEDHDEANLKAVDEAIAKATGATP